VIGLDTVLDSQERTVGFNSKREEGDMKAKTRIMAGLVICMFLLLAGLLPSGAHGKEVTAQKPIVLGWVLSLSGPMAGLGIDAYKPALALVEHINKEGGIAGHPVKLIFADTESDATKGVIAAKRLVMKDNVHMLLGDTSLGVAIPVGLAASQFKIPHLVHTGSEAFGMQMKKAGKEAHHWNFAVIGVMVYDMMTVVAKWSKTVGTKVGVLYPDSAFGKACSGLFMKLAPKYGLEIALTSSYPMNATVFGPQIAAIKGRPDLDVLVFTGAEFATGLCIAAVREAGITLPIGTESAMLSAEILKVGKIRKAYQMAPTIMVSGGASDGFWETLPPDDPRRPVIAEWSALHEKFVGRKMSSAREAYAFGTLHLLKDVWGRLLKDQPDILDKDLASIRAAARDYTETVKNVIVSSGATVSMSPEDHLGLIPGTCFMLARFRDPPPHQVVPGFEMAPPPWRR
jgi:branched-chain amino acid transport system substrate-binding protein